MWKRIIQLAFGKDCDLKERMFRAIILIGGLAAILGITECVLLMDFASIVPPLLLLLLAMGAGLFATFRYRKIELVAMVMGLVILMIVFPTMFCLSGGIEGGAAIWFALGLFYVFIMFSGKKLFFFLLLALTIYGITYGLTYYYPEMITPMSTRAAMYLDSLFSVIAVGVGGGGILKMQMKIFEEEHKLTIAQKEELEKNSNSKNVFFANMSHEIRTPINTIIGLNEMILRGNPTEETREYAQDIQLASKMLLSQVNDILDLSQMEMKKMKIVPVEYQTREMFGELVEMVRVRMKKKELDLCLNIDPNLPSVLFGDEKRLKQVLLNILDNAVKYTKEGSVTLSAHGEENDKGEIMLKIKVADTGIGIRKEDLEYIYDSFNRMDENKNVRIEGSGLGLTITKQLVDLMDGEINVDSIYTKGTIFTVRLKQKIVDNKPIGNVDFLKRGRETGVYYRPSFEAPEARILIVDDNRMNAKVASSLLQFTKVQVDIVSSGAECLELTQKKFYHVILMDYMMPVMSGTEALNILRSQENGLCKETAVVALTANAVSGARQLYKEQGFDGYVEKPIQGGMLEAEILRFLPSDIIEYQDSENITAANIGQMQKLTVKKRKKRYITTDCLCDIPTELLEKYDIKVLYLYVRTEHGRFMDTKELDSDSFTQYMSTASSSAYANSVTVEEYEEFFAEALTQAERVIHISMASRVGSSYDNAVTAARGFDHVRVIDSGQVSSGQALVVLYAAQLAIEGKRTAEICDAVEKMKGHIQSRFIMPGADILYQNGRTREITAKACRMFRLHPMLTMRQKKIAIVGLLGGSIEEAWKQGIYWHFRNKRKISREIVVITHVGCSVKQQEWIRNEIAKYVPFENIMMQKASFSSACNSGLQTIGISYYNM